MDVSRLAAEVLVEGELSPFEYEADNIMIF
jgi:hypothetical protein